MLTTMRSDTLIIIPAYNEEKAAPVLISSIRTLYPDMDIVLVSDGSSDKTAEEAEKAGAVVLSHPFNMGYGVALQTGYKFAVRKNYRYLVQLDGDGQHAPESIGNLLAAVKDGSYDIALGSRFLGKGNYTPSIYRRIGINLFRLILRLLSGKNIKDITTGFQAMNRKVLNLFAQDVFPADYPDADVIILLSKLNFRITEVPVIMYPNQEGRSMHRNPLKVLYYVFKMFLAMFLTKLRRYSLPGNE